MRCILLAVHVRIRLHLVKHLMIKMSEISLTQRFDDSMSSFSSEENKRIKILQLNIYREAIERKKCACKK